MKKSLIGAVQCRTLRHYLIVFLLLLKQASYSAGDQHFLGIILYNYQPNANANFRTHFVSISSSPNEPTFLLLQELGIRLTQGYPDHFRVLVHSITVWKACYTASFV